MIDPKWIDVDFTKERQYVMGCLAEAPGSRSRFAAYGDNVELIPESQWRELAEAIKAAGGGVSSLVTRIFNQSSEGSCVSQAWSQSAECTQAKVFGKDKVVHLSAISLYKRIGRSPGSGAMVGDGMDEAMSRGILPLDNPENRARFGDCVMPNIGFYTKYPANWEATAQKFRLVECYTINSVEEMFTALLRQDPVVVGRAGHSIMYADLLWENGRWVVKYANSWGDWGDNGYGYDSANLYRSAAREAYAVRSIVHQN